MNQQYALERIEEFIFCIQKFRSNTLEATNEEEKKLLPTMFPWMFGDKCPLEVLVKVSDRGWIIALDYYNIMTILHQFMPETLAIAAIFGYELGQTNADVSILTEWEE